MTGSDSTPDRDDLPTLFTLPFLSIDRHGVVSGNLTLVTEDGRQLRIISVRHPDGDVYRAEITVAEGDR